MKIITFGSCLSRYTANHFCRMFGGSVISSVYHNRSDAFVGKFLKRDWIHYPESEIQKMLNDSGIPILRNQYDEWIGMHNLKKRTQLFETLDRGIGNLIIIDNFMDISARLLSQNPNGQEGVFLRPQDFLVKDHKLVLKDHLSIDVGIESMLSIVNYFRSKLPRAIIVFINFPNNIYESSPQKVARLKDYESKFFIEDALIIPALKVHKKYQTEEKSHFQPAQYAAYAGIVYHYTKSLNSKGLRSRLRQLRNFIKR
jgi:hypothetical protein